jgi:hypothetical protein
VYAAVVAAVVLAAGIAYGVSRGDSTRSSESSLGSRATTTPSAGASGRSSRSPVPPTYPAGGPSSTPTGPTAANLRQGLMTKPLTQLRPGDRIVYNMQVLKFRTFVGGDVDVSRISCPRHPEPFHVRTLLLVPVEHGD